MEKFHLKSFKNNDFEFLGCNVYSNNNLSFLINKNNGSTILVKKDILKEFNKKELNENLKLKLIQRGFANFNNTNDDYTKFEKDYLPTNFCIELTQSCNLRCKYCFRDFESINKKIISEDMIEKICSYITNYCKKNKIYNITIQPWGGEPLLCIDQILSIKKFFDHSEIKAKIIVETNGTLITSQMADILHQNEINIGISLDGCKSIHDFQRTYLNGMPTFDDIMKGIENLNNVGHSYGILAVVTNYSAEKVEEILDFFAKVLKRKSFKFNMIHPSENDNFNMAFDINKASVFAEKLVNKLVSLNEERYYIKESSIVQKLGYLLNFNRFCKTQGCQYGNYQVSFDSNGNIYPCELTQHPEEILGNIKNDSNLRELILNSNKNQSFFIKEQEKQCKECDFWCGCRGGCSSAVKYKNNKNINIDKIQCAVNKFIYPKLIELILNKPSIIEKLIGKKVNFIH